MALNDGSSPPGAAGSGPASLGPGSSADNLSAFPTLTPEMFAGLGLRVEEVGVVIVDHGSRRAESNELLLRVVDLFRETTGLPLVEAAHMELAEPSIATAVDRVVAQGARLVVAHPYFLSPGRHWRHDIPELVSQAVARHDGVRHLVTAPLGLHPLMQRIMQHRIWHCLQRAMQQGAACDACEAEQGCGS